MRCPDCMKFVSLDFAEPELDGDPEVSEDGEVTCQVRLVRTCGECGQDLKEATLDLAGAPEGFSAGEHRGEGHALGVEAGDVEQVEEGGGRYKKSYYGASVSYDVTCSCSTEPVASGALSDKVAASAMEELV